MAQRISAILEMLMQAGHHLSPEALERWLHLLDLTPSGAGEAGDTRSQRSGTIAEDRASLLKREPVMQSPTSRAAG